MSCKRCRRWKRSFVIVLFFCVPWFLFSRDIFVDFLEGCLEVKQGSCWVEADIGDTIPRDTYLRIDSGTLVELLYGDTKITLSNKGTYSTLDLIKAANDAASWGLRSFLSGRLKTLFKGLPETGSASMGVRAAEVKDDDSFEWADEGKEAIEEGEKLLEEERFEEAAVIFIDTMDYVEDEFLVLFYIGYAYTMCGKNSLALKYLNMAEADDSLQYYEDFVLLKGELLIESHSYEAALELFKSYLEKFPEGETAQTACFFSSFCSKQLGRDDEAVRYLKKAYELNPSAEIGKSAESILGSM